jgi:hypothetical protein
MAQRRCGREVANSLSDGEVEEEGEADPSAPAQERAARAEQVWGYCPGVRARRPPRSARAPRRERLTFRRRREKTAVERWSRSARTHVTRECSVARSRYTLSMYSADEVNKSAAATNIRMVRCLSRYHRQPVLHRARCAYTSASAMCAPVHSEDAQRDQGAAPVHGVQTASGPPLQEMRLRLDSVGPRRALLVSAPTMTVGAACIEAAGCRRARHRSCEPVQPALMASDATLDPLTFRQNLHTWTAFSFGAKTWQSNAIEVSLTAERSQQVHTHMHVQFRRRSVRPPGRRSDSDSVSVSGVEIPFSGAPVWKSGRGPVCRTRPGTTHPE